MEPLPYTWPAAIAFWSVLAWAMFAELPFIRSMSASPNVDKGSMHVVTAAGAVSSFLAFFFASSAPSWSIRTGRLSLFLLGIVCIAAGGRLRRHCFRMLGDHFTYDVRVAHGQRVVESGAYRYVRHPSYTAGLLILAGVGLGLGNWLSVAVAIFLPLLAYWYRIAVEERALVEALGTEYSDYMKRTRRLIPFVL